MELYLFALREGKNIFLARQILAWQISARQRRHGFHNRPYPGDIWVQKKSL